MRRILRALCGISIALGLLGPNAHAAAGTLSIVSGDKAKRSIELDRMDPGSKLQGKLTVVLMNSGQSGVATARYFPNLGGAITPGPGKRVEYATGKPPKLTKGAVGALQLVFTQPVRGRPADLDGSLLIELRDKGKRVGGPLVLDITGTGDPLAGVALHPAMLSVQVNDPAGPFGNPNSAKGSVELRGPGVPGLFRTGILPPSPSVVLRDGHGRTVVARISALTRTETPTVASATIKTEGPLVPGSYRGDMPLSDLVTNAPKLSVVVNARDAFPWAVLAVLVGALAGGLLYLASNLSRRKRLMQTYIKETLNEYVKKFPTNPPVWRLELGDPDTWYRVKWSAMPELDGVQGIWSSIHWARNDGDLELAATPARGLIDRVSRWFSAIEPARLLAQVARWAPGNVDKVWTDSKTWSDTDLLRRLVETSEPADEAAANTLLQRMHRQARWHAAYARVWHIRTLVGKWVLLEGADETRRKFDDIKFVELQEETSPEADRTQSAQLKAEQKLERMEAELRNLYPQARREELEPDDSNMAVAMGKLTVAQAEALPTPEVKPAVQETTTSSPSAISSITRQDFLWSLLIVLVTCAVYVPVFYHSDWGSLGDYASAVAAGFLGKVVINWAVLPAFQSMSPWKAPVAAPAGDADTPAPTDKTIAAAADARPALPA